MVGIMISIECILLFGSVACAGDQGGALYIVRGGEPVQFAVASWGYGCALPKYPSVYVTIGGVGAWVRQQTGIA